VAGELENPPQNTKPAIDQPPDARDDPRDGVVKAPVVLVPLSAADAGRARRRILLICWAAGLIVLGVAGYLYKRSVDPIHAQESYDAGVRLLKITRNSQAILSFDRAIALRPDFVDAYMQRGRAFVGDSQTARAIRDFTKVIEFRPNDVAPLIARGNAYIELKDYQSAIVDANRALEIDPKTAPAYTLRGVAVRSTGNLQSALQDFSRAITLAPDEIDYYERGATYQMLNQHQLAIADFTQLIAIRPDAAAGYFARAESLRATGDLNGAQEDFAKGRLIDGR